MNVGIYVGGDGPQSGGGHAFVRAVLEGLRGIETRHSLRILHAGFSDLPLLESIPVARVAESQPRPLGRRLTDRFRSETTRREIWDRRVSAEVDGLGLHLLWFVTPATLPTTLPYVATVWDLAHRLEPEF